MTIYEEAAEQIFSQLKEILQRKDHAVLGIVGGRTTQGLFQSLVDRAEELDGTIHVFWLDERLSDEKNYIQAMPFLEQLSEKIAMEWYPLKATSVQEATQEIREIEQQLLALGGFDIVIASSGEDGHIASLFPGRTLESTRSYCIVKNSPKPPAERITITPPLLLTAQHGHLFFVGESKKTAYEKFSDSSCPVQKCPAKILTEIDLQIYTDFS